jgi:hypothetical protein
MGLTVCLQFLYNLRILILEEFKIHLSLYFGMWKISTCQAVYRCTIVYRAMQVYSKITLSHDKTKTIINSRTK